MRLHIEYAVVDRKIVEKTTNTPGMHATPKLTP